jgi:hypothetical protein
VDDERFDAVIRVLGGSANRRALLVVLAGVAGLTLTESAAKRRGRGKKRRRRARGRVQAARNGDHKVSICHRTGSKKKPFQVITIAESAVADHAAHGDLVGCPTGEELDLATCTCECIAGDPNPACEPRCDCGEVCKVNSGTGAGVCCRYAQQEATNLCGNGGDFAHVSCQETCDNVPPIGFIEIIPCTPENACGSLGHCGRASTCIDSECCGFPICVPICGPRER